ncbi:haloacid dehalogenase type II [Sediminibacter sp. Hel_I_10]|uniref:haloacid dehalogenase type II n=1 Tax=Sediminibacter sp. Hel_I_10 TaxID=1392490 RepID=UPI000479213A|nr:haloacid dehalogenase type II [Sediminibacter sp. Hel_I_10]
MKYTLAFDVYGTLINTSGVFNSLQDLIGDQAQPFMDTWRNKQLEYSFRRGLMNAHVDFSICTKDALEFACQVLNINLSALQKNQLMEEYKVLPTFSDVDKDLEDLKASGHKLYAFSNGSKTAVSNLLEKANIANKFHGIISTEGVSSFKPNPKVYEYFNDVTKSSKSNSWLISSNSFDVIGAISYGMQSAWLQRTQESILDPWGIVPTAVIKSLKDLSAVLKS